MGRREVLEVIGDIIVAVAGAVFAEERLCGGACRGRGFVRGRRTRETSGRHGCTQDNTHCSAGEDGQQSKEAEDDRLLAPEQWDGEKASE